MTSLHELFLTAKTAFLEAVAAVQSATTAAAEIVQAEIQDAVQAVMALDDALSFFGLVGSPIDALCSQFAQQLTNLAFALDNRGYYAIYRKTFGAQAQFVSAKQSYDGFTGGLGGKSSGGGAKGSWGEADPLRTFQFFGCQNRNGAHVRTLGSSTPPPAEAIDVNMLLGPCSDVFVYAEDNPNGFWQAGIYQYARLKIWVRFVDLDVIFDYDWNESPAHPEYSLSYSYVITDRTAEQVFRYSFAESDWQGVYYNSPVPTWPYDSSYVILTPEEEAIRDVQWEIKGRHTQWDHDYWLYGLSYWEVWHQAGIPDGLGGFYGCGRPEQLQFMNPCADPTTPGKDIMPKPIPIPIPILTDDKKRQKAMDALRLGLEFKPYEIMCSGQKITCDAEQVTCGEI